MTDTYGDL